LGDLSASKHLEHPVEAFLIFCSGLGSAICGFLNRRRHRWWGHDGLWLYQGLSREHRGISAGFARPRFGCWWFSGTWCRGLSGVAQAAKKAIFETIQLQRSHRDLLGDFCHWLRFWWWLGFFLVGFGFLALFHALFPLLKFILGRRNTEVQILLFLGIRIVEPFWRALMVVIVSSSLRGLAFTPATLPVPVAPIVIPCPARVMSLAVAIPTISIMLFLMSTESALFLITIAASPIAHATPPILRIRALLVVQAATVELAIREETASSRVCIIGRGGISARFVLQIRELGGIAAGGKHIAGGSQGNVV
jgi:hypothetical protein